MTAARTILYVHSSDEMYGADLILLQLLDGLDPQSFRPIVVLPTDVPYQGLLTQALKDRGIQTIHLKTAILRRKYFSIGGFLTYLGRLAASTFAISRIISREQVSLVHSNTASVVPGALAAQFAGKPHIWHIHEIIVYPRLLWRVTSWMLPRLSARVVAVSGPTRDHLVAGSALNLRKAIVIHNGIKLDRFERQAECGQIIRSEWGIQPNQPLVGMVGRISHWKGQEYFLRAASIVAKAHPEARFALVGGTFPGQEKLKDDLHALTRELNLERQVIISDYRKDVPALLAAFDIFVSPSTLPDPFPTVVLEAMAASKPVVANAHGGCTEMVVDGETGLLATPGQVEKMAEAICFLIEHPQERARMGKNGRDRLVQEYTLKEFIRQWENVYQEALQQAHGERL